MPMGAANHISGKYMQLTIQKVQQRQQILTFGVIAFTMRGDTIPGIVAKQLAIPNTSPAYLVMKDITRRDSSISAKYS